MNVRFSAIASLLFVSLVSACSGGSDERKAISPVADISDSNAEAAADKIFTNANVYTVSEAQPWAEAVAVSGNEIVFVGSADGAEAFIGDGTEIIDAGGGMVLPGFVEMPKAGEAKFAMKSLNNKTIGNNKIRVKKAEDKNT